MSDLSSSISRRTVAKGAAWTAPAVAIAAAAPSLAASSVEPEATFTQITIDQNVDVNEWGAVEVTGRARNASNRPVDGAIPAGTSFTLTPSEGAIITIDAADQVGITSIEGPSASGSYTVFVLDGVVDASLYARLDVPGSITVEVFGPAPGGPSTGTWV